jgi:hypothetical protein
MQAPGGGSWALPLWGCRGLLFDFFNPIYVDIRALVKERVIHLGRSQEVDAWRYPKHLPAGLFSVGGVKLNVAFRRD